MAPRKNNGMSVSIYRLPQVYRTLVPEIHVLLEMLHVLCIPVYDLLTCVNYNLTEQQERSSAM